MIKFHKHYFCSIVFWYLIFEKKFIPYFNSTIFLIPSSFGKDMLVETTRLLKHKSKCLLSLSKYHELMAHIHSEWEWYQIIWIERVKGEVRTVLASPPTLCFLHTDKKQSSGARLSHCWDVWVKCLGQSHHVLNFLKTYQNRKKKLKNCLQMFQSQWKRFGLAICYSGTFSYHLNKYNQPVVSPCTINGGCLWTGSSRPSHDSERTQPISHCLRNPHLITQNAESQLDCILRHEQWSMLICFGYII